MVKRVFIDVQHLKTPHINFFFEIQFGLVFHVFDGVLNKLKEANCQKGDESDANNKVEKFLRNQTSFCGHEEKFASRADDEDCTKKKHQAVDHFSSLQYSFNYRIITHFVFIC